MPHRVSPHFECTTFCSRLIANLSVTCQNLWYGSLGALQYRSKSTLAPVGDRVREGQANSRSVRTDRRNEPLYGSHSRAARPGTRASCLDRCLSWPWEGIPAAGSPGPRNVLLGALHPERDREDITRFHPLDQWLIERLHEGKRVRCRLWHPLSLKEPVLAQVDGSFHLPGGKVEPNRDRQVITRSQHGVHLLLIQRRQAGQELRVGGGRFSFRDAKDALPLPVAIDQGCNPEDCFKHRLLLSARMKWYSM